MLMNKPSKIVAAQPVAYPGYQKDGYGWAMAQGALLRERRFDCIDWDNIAEEIETMGRSERRAYKSQLIRVLIHMLKWEAQPERRGKSWWLSIVNGRKLALEILDENPSLKHDLPDLFTTALESAREDAMNETGLPQSVFDAIDITLADAFDRHYERPEGD
jgi:Domain of unknown function DUF29